MTPVFCPNSMEFNVKLRTLGMMLILVLLAVFLIINWSALSQETTVNLVYTEITAPLGIIVVVAFAAIIALLMIYTIWQQASVVMEIRQAHKEARIARQAAEDADKSRITELGKDMRARMDQLEALMVAKTAQRIGVSEKLLDIDKKVSNVLPATEGEVKDEKKKKELFGELF